MKAYYKREAGDIWGIHKVEACCMAMRYEFFGAKSTARPFLNVYSDRDGKARSSANLIGLESRINFCPWCGSKIEFIEEKIDG